MMENKTETTIVYWGYIGIMENRMKTYTGITENEMETKFWVRRLHRQLLVLQSQAGISRDAAGLKLSFVA